MTVIDKMFQRIDRQTLILSFFSFLIVAFGQPAWISGLGVIASAIGYTLFWRGMLLLPTLRDQFLISVVWYSAVQGVQLSWMATTNYMGPFILVLYLFLIVAMGVQFGLLSFFIRKPLSLSNIFNIAGCWVILEWLRLFFLCGFTWNPVGLALTDSLYSLQFASVWGVFGLSFWVVLVNVMALKAFLDRSIRLGGVWALLAAFPYLFGFAQQKWVESQYPVRSEVNVALIQTALFPEQKEFDPASPHSYVPPLSQWERIFSVLDGTQKVDLMVFPEAALPFGAHRMCYDLSEVKEYFQESVMPPLEKPFASLQRGGWKVNNAFMIQSLANHFKTHIVIGLDDLDADGKAYNAAFHFFPQNLPYERYEKRVLVPLTEYLPMPHWPRFSRYVAKQFGILGSFEFGKEAKVFHAPCPVGMSICLEETFSGVTRDLRVQGAEVFVNLTNDAWFPGSKLPQQHFDHGRVRAAENGVAILRACNTGVTGGIDCFGKPLAQLVPSETEVSSLYFSLPIRTYSTLYTKWGDQAILVISCLSMISYFLLGKKKLL